MTEAVHILDATCDAEAVLEAGLLAGDDVTLLSVGPPPRISGWRGRRTVKAVRLDDRYGPGRGLLRGLAEGEAVAHCWSLPAARAVLAEAPTGAVVARVTGRPDPSSLCVLPGRLTIAAATADDVAVFDASAASVVVIDPMTPPAPSATREDIRESLGLTESEVVIAAPGGPDAGSGHRLAVWAVAILTEAAFPVRLLIEATGPGAREVMRFAREAGFGKQVLAVGGDVPLADMLAASDLALLLRGDRVDPITAAAVVSAGLAAVISAGAGGERFAEDAVLRADAANPRAIAQAMMKFIEDVDLAARLSAAARKQADELPGPDAVRARWSNLYTSLGRRPAPTTR